MDRGPRRGAAAAALLLIWTVTESRADRFYRSTSAASSQSSPGAEPVLADQFFAPKIFNSSLEGRPGDLFAVQGANFDPSTKVWLGARSLPIIDRVGASWLAVQLPTAFVGPPELRVVNRHGASSPIRINAPVPQMLDTTSISAGGRFRVLGRNLMVPGRRPSVLVGGRAAKIDLEASDENMLVLEVPQGLPAGSDVIVQCDNGNGAGASSLSGAVRVEPGSGDPMELGAAWGGGFDFGGKVIKSMARCDGVADAAPVINEEIKRASERGGAIIEAPAGVCRIASTINLASRVVLRGASDDKTVLRYETNYPLYAVGLEFVGLQGLALVNAGLAEEGAVWKDNKRSFIKDVDIEMKVSRQWFLTGNRDFLFDHNTIRQTGSYDLQNPYRFDLSSGLVFSNNQSLNVNGSPTFQHIHDSLIINNRFTRDASSQFETTVIAHHGLVADFAYRTAIVRNTFDNVNGPVVNKARNDGETLLVEGGGPVRTESLGTVGSSTSNSLSDDRMHIDVNPFGTGMPDNLAVAIVSGKGAGQTRRIVGYDGSTIRIDRPWDVQPETGSHYSAFVWGLDKVLIKNNLLLDNPRGIWLYQCSIRDVTVQGNKIRNGGGIYLRSYQNVRERIFTFQTNTLLADNLILDENGRWVAQITSAAVRADEVSFGIQQLGIEIRRNLVAAHAPNVTSSRDEYASREGFASLTHIESSVSKLGGGPSILGTILQMNSCVGCERPFMIGSGSEGTVLLQNKPDPSRSHALTNVHLLGKGDPGAEDVFAP